MLEQETVYEALKQIIDPEVGINIVDMGLIYDLEIGDQKIDLTMTLTSPACPAGPMILSQIDNQLKTLENVDDAGWHEMGRAASGRAQPPRTN